MVDPALAFDEAPVVFGRDQSLVGTQCLPRKPAEEPAFVVFINSGIIHRAGPNRLYVRIARSLAAEGLPSLRFDLSGIGDSVLPPGAPAMSIQERVEVDIDDALAFASARYDARRFVLIGLCSGADNALRTMYRRPEVAGSVLLDLNTHLTLGFYVRWYAHRLFSASSWLNVLRGVRRHLSTRRRLRRAGAQATTTLGEEPRLNLDAWVPRDLMRQHFETVVNRDAKILCVFTGGLPDQYNYRRQLLDLFPGLDYRGNLTLEYFGDSDHTFTTEARRTRLLGTILHWFRANFHVDSASSAARPLYR